MKPLLATPTIHLPGGLIPGDLYWVDADADYVQECLQAGWLVPETNPLVIEEHLPQEDAQ